MKTTKSALATLIKEATKEMSDRMATFEKQIQEMADDPTVSNVPTPTPRNEPVDQDFTEETDKRKYGLRAAQMIAFRYQAGGDNKIARDLAHRAGAHQVALGFDKAMSFKALSTAPLSGAGSFIPEQFSLELIELLRNEALFRSLGPRIVPMPNGSLTLPKQTGASVLGYLGESENYVVTQPSAGNISLQAKKAGGVVPMTEEFMNDSPINAAEWVRDDLVQALRLLDDSVMIRSAGGENKPTGIRYQVAAANILTATGGATPTSTQIEADLARMLTTLLDANIPMQRPGWMMSNREFVHLAKLRDATSGEKIFPEMMTSKTLMGAPVKYSAQIPTTLGSGSESEIYFGDFAQAIVGETGSIELSVAPGAAYHDGVEVQSSFSRDEVPIKVRLRNDMKLRHNQAFVVLTATRMGG
jgi:HK97 family phage major capsid protein